MDIKQVIVIRNDLNMRKGKMCAQASHASMAFLIKGGGFYQNDLTDPLAFHNERLKNISEVEKWTNSGYTKICLQVSSEEELVELHEKAIEAGLLSNLITDKGLTEFNGVPTKTCIAIGPNKAEEINKITGNLRLL